MCRECCGETRDVHGRNDTGGVFIALRSVADGVVATELDETAQRPRMSVVRPADLPDWVAEREAEKPRWVWNDTSRWYPPLLEAGTRVERALDLRLCRRILRASTSTAGTASATAPADEWDDPAPVRPTSRTPCSISSPHPPTPTRSPSCAGSASLSRPRRCRAS